jgi:hypothetical protein
MESDSELQNCANCDDVHQRKLLADEAINTLESGIAKVQ